MLRDFESLINVIPGAPEKQNGVEDKRACQLFKYLWEEQYSRWPVQIVYNSHDFGNYPDVEMHQSIFNLSYDMKIVATNLIDCWNEEVKLNEISEKRWQEIQIGANLLTCEKPFRMEY